MLLSKKKKTMRKVMRICLLQKEKKNTHNFCQLFGVVKLGEGLEFRFNLQNSCENKGVEMEEYVVKFS